MPKSETARAPSPPHNRPGLDRFAEIRGQLEGLLDRLWAAHAASRKSHTSIPQSPGIYLFTEKGKPMYVGQTRKLRNRLRAHTVPSATQEQASFAYRRAKKQAFHLKLTGTRKVIATHVDFVPLFEDAKRAVAAMDVRFIEIPEPDLRTIFEVYASLALGTGEFNSFETH